jgi:outer membrane receptor protein involved in Fe transport
MLPVPRGLLSAVLAASALGLVVPAPAIAQLQVAHVRGVVTDPQGQPIAGATIAISDPLGNVFARTTSGTDGSFRIDDVVPGSYSVQVDAGGMAVLSRPLVVRGSLPIELTLTARPTLSEDVLVQGDASANAAERPLTLAGDAVRRSTEPLPSQRVQAALATLPGWSAEDNGLLHVRGSDDGFLYVQDGIPVYERLDRLFGLPPAPAAIDSMHVLNGYVPPEFGFKGGAVVVVRSATGLRGAWNGSVDAGLADLGTRHVQGVAAGPLGRSAALMVTAADERSSRFLDPVALENNHNEGRASSASAQLTWTRDARLFTASLQGGAARYDVPNTGEQEGRAQDQRQRTRQLLFSAGWQQARSERTVWQISAYARHGEGALIGSRFDTPITAASERTDNRYGALWSVNHQRNRHTFKAGGEASWLLLAERFTFAVTDAEEAEEAELSDGAIAHGIDNPFAFADRRRPWMFSFYAQDAYRASDRLTVNFGARLDRSRLLVHAWQLSPRAGVAYALRPGTTLRASVMRLFQPPQAEYLLLSSSEEARELSPFEDDETIGGGASIPPERQTAVDVSIGQQIAPGWQVDATGWWRRATDVGDPNVFVGTTIIFPNSVARQYASGFDVGVVMTPRRGWSGSANYTYARIEQYGPVTGGLFLEDEVGEIQDGTKFIPDHDQRHGLFATTSYGDTARGWRLTAAFRYQTGTPVGIGDDDDGDDLEDLPGSDAVDFEAGRVRARAIVDLQAEWTVARTRRADVLVTGWVNNLTNRSYAFNFGNPFSGTHFGSARRAGFGVRVSIAD